jgi:hypothetical protein
MDCLRKIVIIAALILLDDCTADLHLMAAPFAPLSGGSILYNRYDFGSGQAIARLASIEQDGSRDRIVDLNLIDPTYPVWSKDGQILALTATDPQRPNKASPDIFLLSAETFEVSKITDFQVSAGGGGFAYVLALHKAFSPDKSQIAVSFYTIAGGSGENQVPSVTNIVNGVTNIVEGRTNNVSGISVVPSLQIFNVDKTPGIPLLMMFPNEGLYHGGDGVDWAPEQNRIVYPVKIDVPFENSPVNSYVTALFLLEPVFEPILNGRARQLTFPQGRLPRFSSVVIEWQDDFQPAVSPNRQEVAYIRSDSSISSFSQMASVPSLRIIKLDGSNDRQVVRFQSSDYVTHVNWSPDGNQLVFDFGKQAYSGLSPLQFVSSNTVQLFTVNVDGTGLKQLRAPAAGWPAWQPGGPVVLGPATITALNPTAAAVGGREFDLIVTGANFSPLSIVQWNGLGLQTTFISPTQLRAFVPASRIAAEGAVLITVAALGVEPSNLAIFDINSPTVAPPRLEINAVLAPNGREIIIQWPVSAANFVLETTRTLGAQAGWQEAGLPAVTDGSQRRIAVNPAEATKFYRLRRQ